MAGAERSGFLRAGRIVTPVSPVATGILWVDGRITDVGRAEDLVRRVRPGMPVFDLPRTTVTAGFVDAHTHFGMWALSRRRVQLAGARTRAEAVRRVARGPVFQGWVLGQGWDANGWEAPPDRTALDLVQSGPVYLDSLDVHSAWLNTAALRAAGIDRHTPDPPGGVIVRDAAGEPTGLLKERAVELAKAVLPEPPADLLLSLLLEAQEEALRLGVTGIHNVEGKAYLDAFRELERLGQLRLRVLFHPPVELLPELVASGVRSGQGSDRLRIGGVKLFLDGSLGSRTAWMLEPYEHSRDRGMPITDESVARDAVRLAAHAGIASTIHAIGDAAVRRALDLLTGLPRAAVPHRIEHFQCVHPDDLGRAASLGVVLSMQPAHLLTDIPLVERHWGARGAGVYNFRTLIETGATLAFGSDAPVAPLDPRPGVYAALDRRADGGPAGGWRPAERLDFAQAVWAYTRGSAVAEGMSGRRGTIAPGFDADLVAWDVDPALFRGDGSAFLAGHAALTVVDGSVVMRA